MTQESFPFLFGIALSVEVLRVLEMATRGRTIVAFAVHFTIDAVEIRLLVPLDQVILVLTEANLVQKRAMISLRLPQVRLGLGILLP